MIASARVSDRAWTLLDVAILLCPLLVVWIGFRDLGGWPHNDDPFYGRSVQWAVEDGRFELARQKGVLSASTLTHVVAGIAVSGLVGFSYRALFLACILQQWLGAAAVYGIGRSLDLGRAWSLVLGFVLLLNPLYFGHAFTFMTDGPGAAWIAIAGFAAVRACITRRFRWLWLCACAVAWGFWMRQTNLAVLLAPAAALTLLHWFRRCPLPYWHGILVLSALPILALLMFESGWIVETDVRRIESFVDKDFAESRVKQTLIAAYGLYLILGLSVLPMTPLLWSGIRQQMEARGTTERVACCRVASVVSSSITGLAALPFVATGGRACLTNSTGMFLQNAHFGPVLLSDFDEPGRWGELGGVAWPFPVWQALTVLALLACGLLMWWLTWLAAEAFSEFRASGSAAVESSAETPDRMVCLALAVGFVVTGVSAVAFYLLVIAPVVDRYWLILLAPLLTVLPLLARVTGWKLTRRVLLATGVLLSAELLWNVIFVHDLLAWNNARWQQVEVWLAEGRTPHEIDGGVEVNAWLRLAEDPNSYPRDADTSKWWSGFATLAIATGPRAGWSEVGRLPWSAWATGREHDLLILRRGPRSQQSHTDRVEFSE